MRSLWGKIDLIEDPSREFYRGTLFSRWFELDRNGAVKFCRDSLVEPDRLLSLVQIFMIWGSDDRVSAIQSAIDVLGETSQGETILSLLLSNVSEHDWDNLNRLVRSDQGDSVLRTRVLNGVIIENPEKAAAMIVSMKEGEEKNSAINTLSFYWGQKDPLGALEWVKRNLDGLCRKNASFGILSNLALKNPQFALGEIESLEFGPERNALLQKVGLAFFENDPASAMTWVNTNFADVQKVKFLGEFGQLLAQKGDYEGAEKILSELPFGMCRNQLIAKMCQNKAGKDPAEAIRWLSSLDESDLRMHATNIFSQWAKLDPMRAIVDASLVDGSLRNEALKTVIQQWAQNDFDSALMWIDQNPIDQQLSLRSAAVESMSITSPERAAEYVASNLGDMNIRSLANTVVVNLTNEDPAKAVGFLGRLGDEGFEDAYSSLVGIWAMSDSMKASKWVGELPEGRRRDAAIAQLASTVVGADPLGAARWANSIQNANQRDDTLKLVFGIWASTDPQGAGNGINDLSLNQRDVKLIEKVMNGGGP